MIVCRSQLCARCCVWLVLLVALWRNGEFPSIATAQPGPLPQSKDLTVRSSDCIPKCTNTEASCSDQNNTLCTVGCKCVGNLWSGGSEKRCIDDTEARIVCDHVSGDKDGWAGPMDFTIYSAQEQDHAGTGYRGVVTAVHTRTQRGQTATLKRSSCYKRQCVTSDICGCKCRFALRARPSRMGSCRCVNGV
jgi:hypothetical protein